ncbi:MAG: phosphatase PAP2 family protein [Candidatus Methanoperedens sp.]|nr:phosphatase PAP2 family protein [Candidatus Methanoperedens sp.]
MSILTYLESVDHSIFLDINQDITNPFFDAVFPGLRVFTYVFWLILIVYFWTKKERKLALLITVGIAAGALFTYPLKFLIDRARPYDQITDTRLLTPTELDPSFPSGHAEMSFLAATVISRFHPEYSKYLYAFSFIVALSRIYVGVHFPADAIGGIIVGIIIGKLMIMVARRKRDIFWEGEI